MARIPTSGKILFKDGQYYLEAGGKEQLIPVSPEAGKEQLHALVGHEVEVLHSEPKSFVVGLATRIPGRPPILCYIPVDPWLFGVVDEASRINLAKQFLNEGILTAETHEKLIG